MTIPAIAIVDARPTPMGTTDGQTLAAALNHQVHYHVAPQAAVRPVPVQWYGATVPTDPRVWQIAILEQPDVPNALGYHDVAPNGVPYGRVFAAPSAAAGVSLSSVLSHEVVEAVGDPGANRWADDNAGRLVAFELGDPVQSSAYMIGSVEVSNFVTAAWFDPGAVGPFDHLRHVDAPFAVERGGYVIQMVSGKVSEVFGKGYPNWRLALLASPQPSRTTWREVRLLHS